MKQLSLVLAAIVVIGVGVWAYREAEVGEIGPIILGVSLPLTGEVASYGEAMRAGVEVAAKEINASGGINGRELKLVFEDDKCANTGATVFEKLTSIDKVHAIIGPLCTAAAGPGLPIAEAKKIPTIIWASAPNVLENTSYAFRAYPSDAFPGKIAAEYTSQKLGAKKVAILYIKNDWGEGLQNIFSKRFEELGGTIVAVESAAQDDTDLRTQLTKIKAANPDVIYIPLYTAAAGRAVQQARTLGIKVPMMGGDALDAKEFTELPASDGVLYTIGKMNESDAFKAKIKSETGKDSNSLTPIAYDSVYLFAEAFRAAGTDAEKLVAYLKTIQYTKGESLPLIKFDAQNDLASAAIEIRVVKGGAGVPVQ